MSSLTVPEMFAIAKLAFGPTTRLSFSHGGGLVSLLLASGKNLNFTTYDDFIAEAADNLAFGKDKEAFLRCYLLQFKD